MKTLRFRGRPGDRLLAAGKEVRAGRTAEFEDEDALNLLTDPNVDVVEVQPKRAEHQEKGAEEKAPEKRPEKGEKQSPRPGNGEGRDKDTGDNK